MTAAQIKNSKIDAITVLQSRYNRFSQSLNKPGVDKATIEKSLERIRKDIANLEAELELIG